MKFDFAKFIKLTTYIHSHIGSALQRNAATIARAQSLRDADQNKRREEFQALKYQKAKLNPTKTFFLNSN